MQNTTTSFSWGNVAQRILFKHVDQSRTSLKDRFKLSADPCVQLLVRETDTNDEIAKICTQAGASVNSSTDLESLIDKIHDSSARCPTLCIIDSSVNSMELRQINDSIERLFSASIIQLSNSASSTATSREPVACNEIAAPKTLDLPVDKEALLSELNEFLIMASQLAGHLRRIQKFEALNEREKILVQLISFGVPNKSSASILKLAEKTVEKCRTGVYRKLDVRSTGELASLVTMANFYRWPTGVKVPFKASV